MKKIEKIVYYYLQAKEIVISKGFSNEVSWQENRNVNSITLKAFFSEYAWVVLSSGMKEMIVRRKFDELSILFNEWENPLLIVRNKSFIKKKALQIFNHTLKIDAILNMAQFLIKNDLKTEIEKIKINGVEYLQKFSFLGPATSFHFAKNLGFDVVKPDRHLVRISNLFGYDCPETFCKIISSYIGEKESVVDIVLWRYATLNRNYLRVS
jgi:hypothetical protein